MKAAKRENGLGVDTQSSCDFRSDEPADEFFPLLFPSPSTDIVSSVEERTMMQLGPPPHNPRGALLPLVRMKRKQMVLLDVTLFFRPPHIRHTSMAPAASTATFPLALD